MFAAAPADAATLNIKQAETAGDGLVFSSLPGLISLNVQGTRLSVPQRKVIAQQAGQRLSKLKGRGMEFDEVRPYTPGDDVRHLDWRVTARTGKAHTKLFREERERPILVSVDYRAAMFFASKGVFKSVQAAQLAAMLAWMGNRDGDRVGGQVFTDSVLHDYKPQKGRHSVLRLLNDLAELSIPPWLNQGKNSKRKGEHITEDAAFSHAYDRLIRHARPGTMIFLISDFRDWDSNSQLQVSRMARHSDIALIFLYDSLETGLPADRRFRFTDGKQFAVIDTHSEESRQFYHDHFIQRMNAVESFARSKKIPLLKCSTTDNPFSVLMSRFSR